MSVGNVTGLASGIDWNETVRLLMQLERRPVDALEQRRTQYQSQLTNWSTIETKLTALKGKAEELDTLDEFLVKSGTSSDSDILTVTADSTASTGSHTVLVNQLATNAIIVHRDGWADSDSTAVNSSGGDQSFSFSYAGTAFTITVPDGTTLQGLVNLINQDPNNPGVTASIINDGSGGAAAYHLVLSGDDTGASNTIAIIDTIDNPTNLGDGAQFDAAAWDTTQDSQNAQIRVDGFPDPGWGWAVPWIESESNEVADVIPGVTLNLKATSAGSAVTVEVSLDKSAVQSKINNFIDAYNDLIGTLNVVGTYDTETGTAGPLFGDSLVKTIKSDLSNFLANNIPGTVDGDKYRTLGQAGVSLTAGGELQLEASKLEDALDDDPTAVARLFAFDARSSSRFVTVTGHDENTVGGTYSFTLTYDATGILDPNGTNEIDGVAGVIHGDSLIRGGEGNGAEGLLMLLTNPGDGPASLSGTVTVYTGFGVLVANKIAAWTESAEGNLALTRDRINDSIELLDANIARWETRLEGIEENYKRRFSQMELLIGQLQSQGNFLQALSG